ncbi:MAG: LysM peptidoglycan-binding domain-containing protein, partial [Anaerolineae bacterium]
ALRQAQEGPQGEAQDEPVDPSTLRQPFDRAQDRAQDVAVLGIGAAQHESVDEVQYKPFDEAQYTPFDADLPQAQDEAQESASDDRSMQSQEASVTDEALHSRGLEHLQAGEWEAAVECLSELVERHPDQEYYANLLQQATLKARLGDTPPRRLTGYSVVRSRRVWALVILGLVLGAALLGRQLYQQQIAPALQQRLVVRRQQQLLEAAIQLLAAGKFDEAAVRFEEVLTLNPDSLAARMALDEINRRQRVAEAYDAAITLIEQEAWESALEALEAIRQEAPGFRDVQQQIDRVAELRTLSMRFEEANRVFHSGNWQLAAEQLLLLKEEAPDYKPQAVKQLLVDSYMKQGEAALSDLTATEIEQVQEAFRSFAKAVEVDPANADAARQAELAQEYLDGLEAYSHENWELAGIHLANVYPMASDYADGRAAELLQAVYVEIGNRFRHREEPSFTAERYRQAIALSLIGDAHPVPDEAEELLGTADDLFRQGRYDKAAVVYGNILGMMGFEGVASSEELESDISQEEPVPVEPTPVPEWYIVQPGDTLSGIARQFNTTVAALLEANAIIQDPNLIRPGWRLLVQQL